MTKHVTIVDDDPDIRAILQRSLAADGFEVTALESGVGIEDVLSTRNVDLVLLDIGLPDLDGLSVMQRIRKQSNVGIIIVSGRGDLADRVVGLEVGADDYVTKPFEPREIMARVRSVLRRGRNDAPVAVSATPVSDHHIHQFNEWSLDVTAQSLSDADGNPIVLTSGEFKLLEALVTRANRVLTRDQLMDICHGNNAPAFDRSIDVCIGRLRKKLNDNSKNPSLIRTVRNGGYIFVARVTKA